MGKKNPYITTIGFDKTDSRHVQVAELLNSMTRKKAQYIVDAILAYQEIQEQGTMPENMYRINYEQVRTIVLQVIAEQRVRSNIKIVSAIQEEAEVQQAASETKKLELDMDELTGIMESIDAFRSK